MKQTSKRLISLSLVILCVVSLCACGGKKESTLNADIQSQAEQNAIGLVQTIVELTDSDIENYMNSGDEFTENAMEAWEGSKGELGAFTEAGDVTTEYDETEKKYTVTVPAKFENADSNFVFEFDKTGAPSTLSVEVQYPKSVNLQRAAMNTLMGLGTVFVVLIFLSFVISLLKYIPGWVDSIGKKKQAPQDTQERKTEVLLSEPEELTEKLTEDVSDDTELIAVIAAAIAAAEGTSTDGVQVRTIRKVKRKKW